MPFLLDLLVRWVVVAAGFAVTSAVLSGLDVTGGFWGYVWIAALFGVVNAIIGTILRIITLPLRVVTLGLISVIVSAVLLSITDGLSDHLTIDDFFWTAIWAALVLGIVTVILDLVLRGLLARRTA